MLMLAFAITLSCFRLLLMPTPIVNRTLAAADGCALGAPWASASQQLVNAR